MSELSSNERARYARHFSLAEIGVSGQQSIKNARVLCVGAGGLGATVLYYLAAAGVGTIGIIDPDIVDLSNLQRQIIYTNADIGFAKALIAKQRLLALNPHSNIITYCQHFDEEHALALVEQYDVIVDATDNNLARYLISDACSILHKPDVFAGILQFQGQCSIFGVAGGPCYRCLYPTPPPALNCNEAGVLGVLPGILGCMQATEVLKWIVKAGDPLVGRLLQFDALKMRWTEYKLKTHPQCLVCAQGVGFSQLPRPLPDCTNGLIPTITVDELHSLQRNQEEFILLDVREYDEYQAINMGGYCVPLGQLAVRFNELDKNKLVVVHCHSGKRSQTASALLASKGFERVYNLQGGIAAWLERKSV